MFDISLPAEIALIRPLGSGRRSRVYLADYAQERVVVKVYKQEYIDKYQYQYGVNIGEFEYSRNCSAYQLDSLRKYIARPHCLLTTKQGYNLAFVQEYIEGICLEQLMTEYRGLPEEVLQAGHYIVEKAAEIGLHDLDIPPGNIRLVQDGDGLWLPKLYDFNLMPQHICPPNPLMALGFKLGLRNKNHRDLRSLKHWVFLGKQASKQ